MSETLQYSSEENVLTLLVWNNQHAATLASILPVEIFGIRAYQRIAAVAKEYIAKFHEPPRIHIRDLLETDLRRGGGEAQSIAHAIDSMQRIEAEIQPHYVIAELDKFIRIRRKLNAMDQAYSALQRGDEDKAEEALWQQRAFQTANNPGLWLHDPDLDFLGTTESDEFSYGIEALDRKNVRPTRQTLTVFIGSKKTGKSWSCVCVGKACVLKRRKVLHITLENSDRLTKRRYLQAFFSMTKRPVSSPITVPYFEKDEHFDWKSDKTEEVKPLSLTIDNRKEIVRRLQGLANRSHILIKQFPTGMLTIAMLSAYLDGLERDGFVPDLMIVDYPNLMRTDSSKNRLDIIENYTMLRGICVDRNIAGYAPTQGGRQTENAKNVYSRDVAEAYAITMVADTILTYMRTKKEKERNLARMIVDAARDEEDSFAIWIAQNYAIGQFCLDSVYMTPEAYAEIDRDFATAEHDVTVVPTGA